MSIMSPSSSSSKHQQKSPTSKRKTQTMRHKLNSIPITTLNGVRHKQREKQNQQNHFHYKQQLINQIDLHDDFLSMMLINASFHKLLSITKILIQIINFHHCHKENDEEEEEMITSTPEMTLEQKLSYNESFFSDYTPISIIEENYEYQVSFRIYYNIIYEEALRMKNTFPSSSSFSSSHNTTTTKNPTSDKKNDDSIDYNEGLNHMKNLLKSCFIIGFINDIRIRRFVMSRHLFHYEVMKTKPPHYEKSLEFIEECHRLYVQPFLSSQSDIISMIKSCTELWKTEYMLKIPPPFTEKTFNQNIK